MEILTRSAIRELGNVRMVGEGVNEICTIEAAFGRAEDMGLDLVLVSMDSKPPVVRIQDFKKLEYEKKKARKGNKQVHTTKEIQFKVNISDHDLQTKIDKIEKFLERGDKVKIMVRLKGREKENPQRATELIDRVCKMVDCKSSVVPGPVALAILEPSKAKLAVPKKPSKEKEDEKGQEA